MKISHILTALIALFAHLTATAQNIEGTATDAHTGEPLPYAVVNIAGTAHGTVTDENGHYRLTGLPTGKATAEMHLVGYRTVKKEIEISQGETTRQDFAAYEDVFKIDGVVVSANRNETNRRTAPTLVSVVGTPLLETTNSACLSQGLSYQPGVRVENNCQNCGFMQVRINGLDGPYTQVLIDSRPVFSALAGVYGLEQIPANMIERVEVVRGGGSALFGSSAIAGTINIITKEPLRSSAMAQHSLTVIGGSGETDNVTSVGASVVTKSNRFGLYVFGQKRDREAYDADGDSFSELPTIEGQTIGTRAFIKTSTTTRLTLEYHHTKEFRRGGDNISRPPHECEVAEQTDHDINSANAKFDITCADAKHRVSLYASAQHVDRDSYYGGGKDLGAYGHTTDLTWMGGAQWSMDIDRLLFMPAQITVGAEHNQDDLRDEMLGYNRTIEQSVRTTSLFAQNEWKNDMWSLLIGARADKHNLIDGIIVSPRANVRFNPTENVNLRASYSLGFRAPQAFDEDLHVANVGGAVSMIRLADDLSEEKSRSLSVSADIYGQWGRLAGNLLAEGFMTDLEDPFALREISVTNGILLNERYNEGGARVAGLTMEGRLDWDDKIRLQGSLTIQSAKYNEARQWSDDESVPAEVRIFRTPKTYGYFTLTANATKSLAMALSGTYTGSMLVEHRAGFIESDRAEETPSFMEMGAKISYDIDIADELCLQLNIGAHNIFNSFQKSFDQGPDRDSGYMFGPSQPRAFYFGAKIEI